MAISIISGLTGGLMASLDCWKPVHALFRDDDHFHDCLQMYPQDYLELSDEAVEYAKEALYEIQDILAAIIPEKCISHDDKLDWMTTYIYEVHVSHDKELHKSDLLNFFNDFMS